MRKNILQLNKVGDAVKTDGTPWTKEELQAQIQESLEWGWNGLATITRCRKKTQISIETLLNEYEDIVKQIPEYIIPAARGNIITEKKDRNIASEILLKNGENQHDNEKKWMKNRNSPGKEGRRNHGPHRSNANAAERPEKKTRRNNKKITD